jgi:GTP-binding protein EngB required for normal cell division
VSALLVLTIFCAIKHNHAVPAIVVFTKYDKLATAAFGEAGDDIDGFSDEEVWRYMKNKAKEAAETLCICPWRKEVGKVPLMVSSGPLYFLMPIA